MEEVKETWRRFCASFGFVASRHQSSALSPSDQDAQPTLEPYFVPRTLIMSDIFGRNAAGGGMGA
jgi:hypothetical protein